jgi:hypothetical protein
LRLRTMYSSFAIGAALIAMPAAPEASSGGGWACTMLPYSTQGSSSLVCASRVERSLWWARTTASLYGMYCVPRLQFEQDKLTPFGLQCIVPRCGTVGGRVRQASNMRVGPITGHMIGREVGESGGSRHIIQHIPTKLRNYGSLLGPGAKNGERASERGHCCCRGSGR